MTFLFTDIEGSTRLWEQAPAAMQTALARHDRILREAIEGHGGYIVKARGDGFHAAFAAALPAIQAAVAGQQALSSSGVGDGLDDVGTIRVRMALHSGSAEERDGDYFGPEVNRAARLLDTAHGGQILVSDATAMLVRDLLPEDFRLRDLGQLQLKDLAHPEHVFQLSANGLPVDFPPPKGAEYRPNNLPLQPTSFVGRQREVAEVRQLLLENRLLTLVGTGGVGKTRLALHVASEVLEEYPDGVWFVDLAPLADPGLVPKAVATAVGVRERPREPIERTLLEALRGRRLLIVLDNCEHLVDACARITELLLRSCPQTHILATSREPLRVAGEVRWRVPALPMPEAGDQALPEDIAQVDAVRLFVERAAAIVPGFTVTEENGSAIARIVRQLDGLPLALELAAARIDVLSPEQLADRLNDRFRLLRSGSRLAIPRQQTLRAMIDWSYDLLRREEQVLLQRLAVFAGSFALEAADAVCSGNGIAADEVLDLLSRLVEQSLVVVEGQRQNRRFRLLESIRQYGLERLQEAGEVDTLRRRHAEYFLAFVDRPDPRLISAGDGAWFALLQLELDNFRAVLDWSRDHDLELGLRLATSLWMMWWLIGNVSEGRERLDRLMRTETGSVPTVVRLRALHAQGNLAFRDADYAAARRHFEEMRSIAQQVGDRRMLASALASLGGMLVELLELEAADALLHEALAIDEELGGALNSSSLRFDLGLVSLERGEYDSAGQRFTEGLAIAAQHSDPWGISAGRYCLGLLALAQGDSATARAQFDASLDKMIPHQHRWWMPNVLEGYAAVDVREGRYDRAVRLAAAAARARETMSAPLVPIWQHLFAGPLDQARKALSPTAFDMAWSGGHAMTLDSAIALALEDERLPTEPPPQ